MSNGFAIFLFSRRSGAATANDFLGSFVARQPVFQFADSGPWCLYERRSRRQYRVEYMMPPGVVLTSYGDAPEETVERCLQSIARYPLRVNQVEPDFPLPTLMSSRRLTEGEHESSRFRCSCSFHDLAAPHFADIQALLHDASVFEEASAGIFRALASPKHKRTESVVEEYRRAAERTMLQEGMFVPCQAEGKDCNAICLLLERQADLRFVCDVFFDGPVELHAGDQLIRQVTYKGPGSAKDVEFESVVAEIVGIQRDIV